MPKTKQEWLPAEKFGIPAVMKCFLDQEAVDKTLKRLEDAEQTAHGLTKEQLAIMEANKKKGEEMVRKWEAGDTSYKQ